MPKYPHDEKGCASRPGHGVVRCREERPGGMGGRGTRRYPDMPWEPKQSFDALAAHYAEHWPIPQENGSRDGGEKKEKYTESRIRLLCFGTLSRGRAWTPSNDYFGGSSQGAREEPAGYVSFMR
jgi:hypothetical protein